MKKAIGILGGTFDPIHHGHLRIAITCDETIGFKQLRFIPCGNPPHRKPAQASKQHRLNMLKLALKDTNFVIDESELQSTQLSYTVSTLTRLKNELPDNPINLIIGSDAFYQLHRWYQWETIATLCNLVVCQRPGEYSKKEDNLSTINAFKPIDEPSLLHTLPFGAVYWQAVPLLSISATSIRDKIIRGENPQFLLPNNVLNYIKDHRLYSSDFKVPA